MGDDRALYFAVFQASDLGGKADEVDWFERLDALGRGDVGALAELRRLVTVQLSRMGAYRHRDHWDDLAQEILVRVWRAYCDGKIREAPALPAFVRTSTRNAFIDWVRAHRREVDLPDEAIDAARLLEAQTPKVDPVVELALRGALAELPDRLRELVEVLYLEGLSYEEAALRLGRPRGTINRQQREAMERLRARLGVEAPGEKGGS